MKKIFKLLWILQIIGELRGHRRRSYHGGQSYRRSRKYHPIYAHDYRGGLKQHLLRRLLHGRH